MTEKMPQIEVIENEASSKVKLPEVIEIARQTSNPAKKIALEKGILYTSFNSQDKVSKAVDQLPDSEKVFLSERTGEKPLINPWATMDKLGLPFLQKLEGANEIEISRKGVLDNAITYASNLRTWIDMGIRFLQQPPKNETQSEENEQVMKRLTEAGISDKVSNIEEAEEFKRQVDQALKELLQNFKKITTNY